MATGDTVGSWFNSGFHGHFRSQSRLDFLNEFRQLAKPQPPVKFIKRAHHKHAHHVFSNHDNRHSFQDSALYFEEGMGRRRIPNNTTRGQSKLLAWVPHKRELEKQGAISSVYRIDFKGAPKAQQITQRIIERPKTSFDDRAPITTSYRYAHCEDNPNKRTLSASSNAALTAGPSRRTRAKSAMLDGGSVASCMNWYQPQPPSRPKVPQATSTVVVEPSAPSAPKVVPVPPPPPPVKSATVVLSE